MIPHFTLQRGKMEYLIIRMGDEFHLIDCDEALTKEKRAAVLESGCTPAQMQQMGLSGMTIPRSDIEWLTITGCGFQDDVIFRLKKKKLAFWFPRAYDQQKVDAFFRGIPRKQVKTRRRLKGGKHIDWRIREQNYQLYKKLRPVGWAWSALGILIWIVPLVMGKVSLRHLGWIVLAMSVISVGLDIFMPEYFTLMWIQENTRWFRKKYDQRQTQTRAVNLGFGLLSVVGFFSMICTIKYHFFDGFRLLPPALIATVVVCGGLLLFGREFQEQFSVWLVTVVLALVFNGFAFVPHFNHILGQELTPVTSTIVDKHYSSGKSTNYYCAVILPDGRELDVQVNKTEYEDYEPGDTMDLRIGTGLFGIDYAIDD